MQCRVMEGLYRRHNNRDRAESDRSMDGLEEMQCSVVQWKDDTGDMTTETAQRVIAALMDWKRCCAVSCDAAS